MQAAAFAARDALVEAHLHLVEPIAKHIRATLPPCFELDDLIQSGRLGLLDAATKYRPATGVPFGAYAAQRVRGAILDSFRRRKWQDSVCFSLDHDHDQEDQTESDARRGPAAPESKEPTAIESADRKRVVAIASRHLPTRERRIIGQYYFREGATLREAGRAVGVKHSRASQIHQDALRRMRSTLEQHRLQRAA